MCERERERERGIQSRVSIYILGRFYVYICVDLGKRSVLTLVDEIPSYRNDRYDDDDDDYVPQKPRVTQHLHTVVRVTDVSDAGRGILTGAET